MGYAKTITSTKLKFLQHNFKLNYITMQVYFILFYNLLCREKIWFLIKLELFNFIKKIQNYEKFVENEKYWCFINIFFGDNFSILFKNIRKVNFFDCKKHFENEKGWCWNNIFFWGKFSTFFNSDVKDKISWFRKILKF